MSLTIKYQWTPELRVFLIRSVEKRTRLWKKHQAGAQDNEIRGALWSIIRQELFDKYGLDIDTSELKKTWKNLKDNYIRISKTMITDTSKALKWMYFEHLQFLEDQDNLFLGKIFPGEEEVDIKGLIHEMRLDALTKQYERRPPPPQLNSTNQMSIPDVEKVQIGFYELDQLIQTKQRRPHNLQMFHVERYIGPVEFLRVPKKKHDRAHTSHAAKRIRDNSIISNSSAASSPSSSQQNIKKSRTEGMIAHSQVKEEDEADTSNRHFACPKIYVDSINGMLDEKTKRTITENCEIIRKSFGYIVNKFVQKELLPEGATDYIMDDFDDYIYRNMPISQSTSMVIQLLTAKDKNEYLSFFDMLDKRRRELNNLKVPLRACVDIDTRKEMSHFFDNYQVSPIPHLDVNNLDISYRNSVKALVKKKQIEQSEIKSARAELQTIKQQLGIFENDKRYQVQQEIMMREADIKDKENKLRNYEIQHTKLIEEYARIDDQKRRPSLVIKPGANEGSTNSKQANYYDTVLD